LNLRLELAEGTKRELAKVKEDLKDAKDEAEIARKEGAETQKHLKVIKEVIEQIARNVCAEKKGNCSAALFEKLKLDARELLAQLSHAYGLGPADVDLGAIHVLRTGSERLVLLKRAIGTNDIHVYLSSDGTAWQRAGRKQQLALDHLVVSSGAFRSKVVLYRLVKSGSVLERSVDDGRSWTRAQLLSPQRQRR